jgi:hypothetical protein
MQYYPSLESLNIAVWVFVGLMVMLLIYVVRLRMKDY